MKAKPIEDRIIVLPIAGNKEPDGFYEQSRTTEKPVQGIVKAVGAGKYIISDDKIILTPMNVKIGETVLYGKHVGTDIVIDGITYVVMKIGDAYAIL